MSPSFAMGAESGFRWWNPTTILAAGEKEGISMMDIYRSTTPFVLIQALGMALAILFPQIVLWLPGVLFGRAT